MYFYGGYSYWILIKYFVIDGFFWCPLCISYSFYPRLKSNDGRFSFSKFFFFLLHLLCFLFGQVNEALIGPILYANLPMLSIIIVNLRKLHYSKVLNRNLRWQVWKLTSSAYLRNDNHQLCKIIAFLEKIYDAMSKYIMKQPPSVAS